MSNAKRKVLFREAVEKLGHETSFMKDKRISLKKLSSSYGIPIEYLLKAVEKKELHAHYDYKTELVWVDLLEACYFSYCYESKKSSSN